ncbi:MAG: DUF2889 domain-containing protein [Gammaproteobacteria bacterium]|nr:DUF2889 domain-containing protein [Gammaproteobacteria bacterium]
MSKIDPSSCELVRTKLHVREIRCEGYRRSDGLWDIEATLADTKTIGFFNHERGEIPPGEPIHKMVLVVTLELDMTIADIRAQMPYTPFRICPQAMENLARLIGLRIQPGWMREVRKRIPNTDSCTHLTELLGPVSTTAYQTMHQAIEKLEQNKAKRRAPPILNQCHALASDSAVVQAMWPQFYEHE